MSEFSGRVSSAVPKIPQSPTGYYSDSFSRTRDSGETDYALMQYAQRREPNELSASGHWDAEHDNTFSRSQLEEMDQNLADVSHAGTTDLSLLKAQTPSYSVNGRNDFWPSSVTTPQTPVSGLISRDEAVSSAEIYHDNYSRRTTTPSVFDRQNVNSTAGGGHVSHNTSDMGPKQQTPHDENTATNLHQSILKKQASSTKRKREDNTSEEREALVPVPDTENIQKRRKQIKKEIREAFYQIYAEALSGNKRNHDEVSVESSDEDSDSDHSIDDRRKRKERRGSLKKREKRPSKTKRRRKDSPYRPSLTRDTGFEPITIHPENGKSHTQQQVRRSDRNLGMKTHQIPSPSEKSHKRETNTMNGESNNLNKTSDALASGNKTSDFGAEMGRERRKKRSTVVSRDGEDGMFASERKSADRDQESGSLLGTSSSFGTESQSESSSLNQSSIFGANRNLQTQDAVLGGKSATEEKSNRPTKVRFTDQSNQPASEAAVNLHTDFKESSTPIPSTQSSTMPSIGLSSDTSASTSLFPTTSKQPSSTSDTSWPANSSTNNNSGGSLFPPAISSSSSSSIFGNVQPSQSSTKEHSGETSSASLSNNGSSAGLFGITRGSEKLTGNDSLFSNSGPLQSNAVQPSSTTAPIGSFGSTSSAQSNLFQFGAPKASSTENASGTDTKTTESSGPNLFGGLTAPKESSSAETGIGNVPGTAKSNPFANISSQSTNPFTAGNSDGGAKSSKNLFGLQENSQASTNLFGQNTSSSNSVTTFSGAQNSASGAFEQNATPNQFQPQLAPQGGQNNTMLGAFGQPSNSAQNVNGQSAPFGQQGNSEQTFGGFGAQQSNSGQNPMGQPGLFSQQSNSGQFSSAGPFGLPNNTGQNSMGQSGLFGQPSSSQGPNNSMTPQASFGQPNNPMGGDLFGQQSGPGSLGIMGSQQNSAGQNMAPGMGGSPNPNLLFGSSGSKKRTKYKPKPRKR